MANQGGGGRGSADRIDFAMVAARALDAIDRLLPLWLPSGHQSGLEYKSVNPTRGDNSEGSFSIKVSGDNAGAWGDFATDDRGGDLISLCAYLFHAGDQMAGVRDVAEQLGIALPPPKAGRSHDAAPASAAPPAKTSPPAETAAGVSEAKRKRATEWEPVRNAPENATPAPVAHLRRGHPEKVWHYRDLDGRTIGYVYRFRASDGDKEILPVCWARHATTGEEAWRWMHFAEPRPLYGLDRIAAKPDATVLIVEGEKCADVAERLFPDLVVLTWPGGTNAEFKADWSVLAGRKVIIWADADSQREKLTPEEKAAGLDPLSKPYLAPDKQPGLKAALKIAARLHDLDCALWLVDIPKPGEDAAGWDVADFEAEQPADFDFPDWLRGKLVAWAPDALQPAPAESTSTPSEASAGKREESWYWNLLRTQKGDIAACVANVYDVLVHDDQWQGVIAFDEHAARVCKLRPPPFVDGAVGEWTANDDTQTAIWITRRYRFAPASTTVLEAVESLAKSNSYHPIRDWLRSLPPWDGTRRLEGWLKRYVGVDHESEGQKEYLRRAGTWFLMGMVARVMKPGCKFDYCLVIEGPQGKKKSTILNALAGDEWFGDTDLDLNNKDAMISLQGKWLYEFSEMGSIARSEEKRQKSFLSRRVDDFREPFARRNVSRPRQLVFAGTTNEWEWNKDPTGGRRFWPVMCGTLDVDALIADRALLFAEALAYYDSGARYWPTEKEQADYFDCEQLRREQQDGFVDQLHDWVYSRVADFSLAEAAMDGLDMKDASRMTRDLMTRVGQALRKLGCTKVEKRNGMTRFWYKPPVRNEAGSTAGVQGAPQQKGEFDAPF